MPGRTQGGGVGIGNWDLEGHMKRKVTQPTTNKEPPKNFTVMELNLDDGASILHTPKGEQWRIASVDADKISFEKLD